MRTFNICVFPLIALLFFGCKKDKANQEIIPIPNGDFELWDNMSNLVYWQTNSCPACTPPFDTYIVKKTTDAANGQFAARFIYNNVYSSLAKNKFSIPQHPAVMEGYLKSNIMNGDTALIHIELFSGNNMVDSGNWYETASTANYKKFEVPLSQHSSLADSALVKIVGGSKQNTELYIDNLVFIKQY